MANTFVTENGVIVISTTAMAQLAYKAVSECFGVVGMPAKNLTQFVRGESGNKGVEVRIKDQNVNILIQIQVLYGTKISEVARNVSEAILYAVEQATGIIVDNLESKITGIRVVD